MRLACCRRKASTMSDPGCPKDNNGGEPRQVVSSQRRHQCREPGCCACNLLGCQTNAGAKVKQAREHLRIDYREKQLWKAARQHGVVAGSLTAASTRLRGLPRSLSDRGDYARLLLNRTATIRPNEKHDLPQCRPRLRNHGQLDHSKRRTQCDV